MPGLFFRRLDKTRSVLLVSSDPHVCSIVEDALYVWRYDVHVVLDPTQAIQEIHRRNSRIVVLDLDSLNLLDQEVGDIITQGLAESGARTVFLKANRRLGANRFENCRVDAILLKPFDCRLLRNSLEPAWQPPRSAQSATCSQTVIEEVASDGKIVAVPGALRAQEQDGRSQVRNRKGPRNCRGLLARKGRSA